jgi:hypothetical protein
MGWVVSVVPPSRISHEAKTPRYLLVRRLGGPQSWSEHRGYREILLPLPGIEPRSPSRPVRSQTLYCLSYPDYLIACYRLEWFLCLTNSELDTFLRITSWYCHWFRFCTSEAAVRLFSSYLLTEMCVQKLVRATARYCVCSCLVWKSDLNLNSWIHSFPTTTIPCVHSCCCVP